MRDKERQDRWLVALDVDGTLLNTEFEDVVHVREQAAIRSLRAAGHVLALCTGRNRRSVADVVSSAGGALDGVPQVLLNGAMVLCGDPPQLLRHAGLEREQLRRVVELFRAAGTLPMIFGTEDDGGDLLTENIAPNGVLGTYLARRRDRVGAIRMVDDLMAHLPEAALEIGTIDRLEVATPLAAAIRAEMGDSVRVVLTESLLERGSYLWVEVYQAECGKGAGLMLLAETLGVPRERTVAVGDNYNDLDMFTAAGHSVAMGNAPPEVRAAADRTAPHVADHGAAVICEEIAAGRYPQARER
ncbi:MAG: HAD family hydrolase [Candidatus Latescibacteria bacterium]|nr:HAD family hydrolase [Candidatus Latescibacterota bacterium]